MNDGTLGPAMSALDDRRRAFVWELLRQNSVEPDQGKAAEAAGFCPLETSVSKNRDGLLRKTGSVLAHEPEVQAAIIEVGGRELISLTLPAILALRSAIANPKSKGHLAAILSVLDRVGFGAPQNINVKHEHTDNTGAGLMKRIRELALKHNLDPDQLLAGQVPRETPALELKAEKSDDGT
jgi:hypothetical protein